MLHVPIARRSGFVPAAALLVLCAGSIGPAGAQSKSSNPPSQPESSPEGSAQSVSTGIASGFLLLGDKAPNFKLRDQANRELQFHAWRVESPAVLLFLDEASELRPDYGGMVSRLDEQGVRTVAICRRAGTAPAGLSEPEVALPILRDRWGDVARQFGAVDRLNGDAVPAVVIVDRKGKVRYLAAGAMPEGALLEGLVYGVLQKEAEGSY